jgi:hypothetical protein
MINSDYYAFLIEHYSWGMSLIRRHYKFSNERLETYLLASLEARENYSIIRRELLSNQNIDWNNFKYYLSSKVSPFGHLQFDLDLEMEAEIEPLSTLLTKYKLSADDIRVCNTTYSSYSSYSYNTHDFLKESLYGLRKVYKVMGDDFATLVRFKEVWSLFNLLSDKFIDFLMEYEYKINYSIYAAEERESSAHAQYRHFENERMLGEDPTDFTMNNTDFDDETIDNAFEGDPDNVWNVD